MKTIHMIVTSGGTREPIDDVRFIGNASTGRLGACIAGEGARRGHSVVLVRARGSAHPPASPGTGGSDGPRLVEFVTASDLERILETEVLRLPDPAAVIMAAAVADYSIDRVSGKIPSDGDELVLRLKKAAKIVDRVRAWKPDVLLVKFKLESGLGRDELLEAGRESARKSQADLMVLNDALQVRDGRHPAVLYWPATGRTVDLEGKESIAAAVVEALEEAVAGSASER
jgi:phosphopantothenoylcysteine synthetase/decarboxylase